MPSLSANLLITTTRLASLALVTGLAGCPATGPHGTMAGRDVFLCCTLRFNHDHEATDANYSYQPQSFLTAGTRVRVVDDARSTVQLQAAGDSTIYRLSFRFGRDRMTAAQWFALILRDTDPRPVLAMTPQVAAAVDEGRIEVGMTKAQVLAARGYPPFHRTPSVDADQWMYFASGKVVNEVRFADGRVVAIVNEPAPGS